MASTGNVAAEDDDRTVSSSRDEESSTELSRLKKDLEGYRELILPLNKLLEWEQQHYPAIIIGVITFIFSIVWYVEPSVLTTFSLLGVLLCAVDFAVPTVSGYLFSGSEWTVVQERSFENICVRLLNARTHINNVRIALMNLKNDKPKMYLVVMMGAFAFGAWIGSLIDNLLLTYLMVVFVVLVPGLRKHGILQRATAGLKEIVTRLIKGPPKPEKTKAQ